MGFYIEVPQNLNKALQLKRDYDAQVVMMPEKLSDVPNGKVLVCVVENGLFDAAGIVYNERELNDFSRPDGRRRTWLLLDTEKAVELRPDLADRLRGERPWR